MMTRSPLATLALWLVHLVVRVVPPRLGRLSERATVWLGWAQSLRP